MGLLNLSELITGKISLHLLGAFCILLLLYFSTYKFMNNLYKVCGAKLGVFEPGQHPKNIQVVQDRYPVDQLSFC